MGDGVSTRNITGLTSFQQTATSNYLPAANASFDLGSSSLRWRNVYSGAQSAAGDLVPAANVTYNLGTPSQQWGTAYVSAVNSSGNSALGGIQYPVVSDSYDLGTPTQKWRYVYSSKQQYVARMTTGTNASGSAPNMTWDTVDINTIAGLTCSAGLFTYASTNPLTLHITVFAKFVFSASGVRNLEISWSPIGTTSGTYVNANGGDTTNLSTSTVINITNGQTFKATTFQNCGSSLAVTGRITVTSL